MTHRGIRVVVAAGAMLLASVGPAAADPYCSVPRTEPCPGSTCDSALYDVAKVVNQICGLGGAGNCLDACACCTTASADLFTGATLGAPNVAPDGTAQWCHKGGRGQLMGEAALCLLRDLANDAVGDTAASPGINLSHEIPVEIANIDLGSLAVKQHVGLLGFDVANRHMDGFQDVSFCLPIFGCVDHVTQGFSATLSHTLAGSQQCFGYPLDQAYVLTMQADDAEHTFHVYAQNLFSIKTPFGTVNISPTFDFNSATQAVGSPFGAPPQSLRRNRLETVGQGGGAVIANLFDVLGIGQGIAETVREYVAGNPNTLDGAGWNSQLALGSRESDPDGGTWNPVETQQPPFGNFPRPDYLSGLPGVANPAAPVALNANPLARNADERVPVGFASIKVYAEHDFRDLIPSELKILFDLREAKAFVEPGVSAAFASQFGVYLDEANFERVPTLESTSSDIGPLATSVRLESGGETNVSVTLRTGFVIVFVFRVTVFGVPVPITIRIDPEVTLGPVGETTSSFGGPAAGAISERTPPEILRPVAADFTSFKPFSTTDPIDGTTFIQQCLTEPPPPGETRPEPSFTPGKPEEIARLVTFPCNACIWIDQFTSGCVPDPDLVRQGRLDPNHECPPAENPPPDGSPCEFGIVDPFPDNFPRPICRNLPLDGPAPGIGHQWLWRASQAEVPEDKQWFCDAEEKHGCFDLCTYDPCAPEPLHVVQSAVDAVGARCGRPEFLFGKQCDRDDECNDANPCTNDVCRTFIDPPGRRCTNTPHDGSCDDGLFCNGPDHCEDGFCTHAPNGNPCAAAGTVCSEDTHSCLGSCETHGIRIAHCSQSGASCDDGNACTDGDKCVVGICRGVDNGACTGLCGNGILDDGEQCDVGLDDVCPGICGTDCQCQEQCANSIDDDGDALIDCSDPQCQGIGCECLPILRDPGRIAFGPPGHDRLTMHGAIRPCAGLEIAASEIVGLLTNSSGVIAKFTLPAGSLKSTNGKRLTFRDSTALATRSGLARLRFGKPRRDGRIRLWIEFFGDLSAATEPHMMLQLRIGSHVFVSDATWTETASGWVFLQPL